MAHETPDRIDWTEWNTLLALRQTPRVLELLAESSGSELAIQTQLRKQFPDDIVRMALTVHELRRKALGKFACGDQLWLDRVGFEQCTNEMVARHKAQRFSGLVWDFCSGIGSDASALVAAGCDVVGIDANPAACLRAKWNADVLSPQRTPHFVCGRVADFADRSGLLHVDPDRRVHQATRAVKLEDYVPGLEQLQSWMMEFPGGALKLSPAANFGGKFSDAEIELISLHGECKEATVWFGSLAGDKPYRATALPTGESLAGDPMEAVADITPLGRYLFDPDPAIVRAGLVDLLAERLGLSRLDASEEYLTGDTLVTSAFVRAFEVAAELPNNPKDYRGFLRDSRIGQLEIKCRHIPLDVDRIRKDLKLHGDQPGVLIFARLNNKSRAVIARRVNS